VATYRFKAVVEPDDGHWYAYCPDLVEHGGATWGETPEGALANLEEVVRMVVASMIEHDDPLPPAVIEGDLEARPLVAVTV